MSGGYTFTALTQQTDSQIKAILTLQSFLNKDDIDGFLEDAQLMKLTRKIDLKIEPHSFAKLDFDKTDPFVREIITNGKRIL